MARKRKPATDPDGIFRGVSAYFVPEGVQRRRLQVWKQKLVQMGGRVQKGKGAKGGRRSFNHVLAADAKTLLRDVDAAWLHSFRGSTVYFEWLEESIKAGERLPEHKFTINYEEEFKPKKAAAGGAGDKGASNLAKRRKMATEEDHKGTSRQDVKKELPTGERWDTSAQHVSEGSAVKKECNYEEEFRVNYEEEFKPKKEPAGAGDKGASNLVKRSKMATEEDHKGTSGRDVKREMLTGEHWDTSAHVHEGSVVKKEALEIPMFI